MYSYHVAVPLFPFIRGFATQTGLSLSVLIWRHTTFVMGHVADLFVVLHLSSLGQGRPEDPHGRPDLASGLQGRQSDRVVPLRGDVRKGQSAGSMQVRHQPHSSHAQETTWSARYHYITLSLLPVCNFGPWRLRSENETAFAAARGSSPTAAMHTK